jgi:AAA family ATP:ADP antiporter
MARGFYKALNIETGEEASVMLLIFQSVFLGVFYGTFDISAHSLFLEVFEQSMIPKAFLVSGVVGIVMTSIYAWLQSRIRFSIFSIINLFFVAILTVLMRFGFDFFESRIVVFVIFVMMGPINILALLGFWGTVGRIFTLRQGKRLFGMIDTGQIIGIIVSSYSIPVLLSFAVETRDLLYISAVSIVVALLFQFIISGRFSMEQKEVPAEEESKSDTGLAAMFKSRYIGYMSLFVVLLISVTIFVHFSFLGVARESYPDHSDLASFFGYFNGTLMVFSVLIKTFVYGRILKTWGLKLALVVSPLLILVFTIVAAVIGGVFGLAASFTMFFLVISVAKLFTKSLQDSIVAPSMKILYQSLDSKIRYSVQARIDGTINEISVLLSSLLAAGLVSLAFFSLVHYTYVLIILLAAWAFVAFKLYQAYRNSLNSSLAKFRQSDAGIEKTDIRSILDRDLKSASMISIRNALGFVEITDFEGFKNALSALLKSASDKIRRMSLRRIDELNLPLSEAELEAGVKQEQKGKNKDIASDLLKRLDDYRSRKMTSDDMMLMAKSANRNDRLIIAMALFELKEFKHHAILNALLLDPDPHVRTTAIQVSAFWKVSEASPVLIDFLATKYFRQAYDALVRIGEGAVESLDQSYYKSGIEQLTLNRITRILGKIGNTEAINSLMDKINYQNREVEEIALLALLELEYQSEENNLQKIIDGVRTSVYQIAWNLAALSTIAENELGEFLDFSFREELDVSFNRLYNLLSIAYDPNSIHHIRQNLESGTSEGIGFAIELLDIFVSDEVKPVLFPVLEDTNTVEKIRQLQVEFPIVIMEPDELLLSVINRDPNLVGPFAKAAAINAISQLEKAGLSDDLLAQVFNPDELLSELAALQVSRMDKSSFEEVLDRISADQKSRLTKQVRDCEEGLENLIWDRMRLLMGNKYLKGLSSKLIYNIAKEMELVHLMPEQSFDLVGDDGMAKIGLLRTGELNLRVDDKELGNIPVNDLVGVPPLIILKKNKIKIFSPAETSMLIGSQSLIDDMMFDNEDLALAMYNWAGDQEKRWQIITKEMVS